MRWSSTALLPFPLTSESSPQVRPEVGSPNPPVISVVRFSEQEKFLNDNRQNEAHTPPASEWLFSVHERATLPRDAVAQAAVQRIKSEKVLDFPAKSLNNALLDSGERLRHTAGHIDCPACEQVRIGMRPEHFAQLTYREAWGVWWELKKQKLSKSSISDYEYYNRSLDPFFHDVKMGNVDGALVSSYQQARRGKVGGSAINHEIECVLKPLCRKAGVWERIRDDYEREPTREMLKRRVFTYEEEEHFFQTAARTDDGEMAYWVASVMNNSGITRFEIRHVQLEDLDLERRVVWVETAKNQIRRDEVPLNEIAVKQFGRLLTRAAGWGSKLPTHYLLPFTVNRGEKDPTRPAAEDFLRYQWKKLQKAACEEWNRKHTQGGEIFLQFTPHCMRHNFCTSIGEDQLISEAEAVMLMRHGSPKMLKTYLTPRRERKLSAVDRLAARKQVPKKQPGVLRAKHVLQGA